VAGEHLSTVDARNQFAEVINRAAYGRERIILTRRGKEIVAVVPIEDVRLLQLLEDKLDLAAGRAALAAVECDGAVPWQALKTELGL
jgi:prevent-host-death family protein